MINFKYLSVKYTYIHKMLNFYKNIRIAFIIYEVIFLLVCLSIMFYISYGLVSFYVKSVYLTINFYSSSFGLLDTLLIYKQIKEFKRCSLV